MASIGGRATLLVVDWSPPDEIRSDGLLYIFDGGQLDEAAIAGISLKADELLAFEFVPGDRLGQYVPEPFARRLAAALHASAESTTIDLEDGWATPDAVRPQTPTQ